MEVAIILFTILVLLFALALFFGAPYLPTKRRQAELIPELLGIKAGQVVFDLGSGDGRVLKIIAQKGAKAVGYEINPLLVIISMIRCWKYRQLIDIHWGNFWSVSFEEADGIYVFLLKRYMNRLNNKIVQSITKPTKVVSFAFAFPQQKPLAQKEGLMLYRLSPSTNTIKKTLR